MAIEIIQAYKDHVLNSLKELEERNLMPNEHEIDFLFGGKDNFIYHNILIDLPKEVKAYIHQNQKAREPIVKTCNRLFGDVIRV